jgi:hypothetical protein
VDTLQFLSSLGDWFESVNYDYPQLRQLLNFPFTNADNRSQTIGHGLQAFNGQQLTLLNLKPCFLKVVMEKRIIIK